ncbi:MAG: glycosyltransferase family 4 protein [Clostridiales bacterium]|nr:glycosyltransferase family 4 protein [Clostridiales bacterium]
MLGHKRVPSREGGVEIVVEELGARMAALGHEVTCYNRKGRHVSGKAFDAPKQAQYRGMKLKYVPTIDKKGIAAMSASFFAAFSASVSRCDVVHFHAEGPCAMLWIPKLFGKRCIATIHGLDHRRAKWGRFAKTYIMLGEKCAARFADEIIVLNKSDQRYFKEKYGRETRLIPNGVNMPENRPADLIKKNYGLEKDGYILYLGRIVPEKGVHYLIEAFRGLDTDKKLVIAGGASDSDEYFESVRKMAAGDGRIVFTDFVQGAVLEELYSNAYIYVLPSEIEGMPLSLLEAMSYGNCCVVSDIPECTEVVGECGITFNRTDSDSLFSALKICCEEPNTVTLYKKQACCHVSQKYCWDEVVLKTLKTYESIGR